MTSTQENIDTTATISYTTSTAATPTITETTSKVHIGAFLCVIVTQLQQRVVYRHVLRLRQLA